MSSCLPYLGFNTLVIIDIAKGCLPLVQFTPNGFTLPLWIAVHVNVFEYLVHYNLNCLSVTVLIDFKFQDFPISFWFLCCACLAYYGAIFPFVSLAKDFFKVEFHMDGDSANFITGKFFFPRGSCTKYISTWIFLTE